MILETSPYFMALPGTEVTEESLIERLGLDAAGLRAFPHTLVRDIDEVCDQLEQRRADFGFSCFTIGDRSVEAFAHVVARMTGK
jgi:hypothetical protein